MIGGYDELGEDKRPPHRPHYNAAAMSAPIDRPNNYGQAGDTYRSFKDWERDELVENLGEALAVCERSIQEAMIGHFREADEDYGRRVKEEMEKKVQEMEQQQTKGEIGREAGPSKYGQGSKDANEATQEAVDKSQEADRY